jgi:hypothetical protein
MGRDCGRLAYLWNCGEVNIFIAEDQGEKDGSDFRDYYDESILSQGQSSKEK